MGKWVISEGCTIDEQSIEHNVIRENKPIHLNPMCWQLLIALLDAKKHKRGLSYDNIGEILWPKEGRWDEARKDTLKKKLDEIKRAIGTDSINNTYGIGYSLAGEIKELKSKNEYSETLIEVKAHIYALLFPGCPQEILLSNEMIETEEDFLVDRPLIQEHLEHDFFQNKRILVLLGNPGSGKTAFLRQYVKVYAKQIAAAFFCKWDDDKRNNISYMIKYICCQLMEFSDIFCRNLYSIVKNVDVFSLNAKTTSELFDLLLVLPCKNIILKDRVYIVIDALDELDNNNRFVRIIAKKANKLPTNLILLLSSRTSSIFASKKSCFAFLNLNASEFTKDVDDYLSLRLMGKVSNSTFTAIQEKCDGNFLYARYLCDNLKRLNFEYVNSLPENLEEVYYDYFDRIFKDLSAYQTVYRQAIEIILASAEGIGVAQLQYILEWSDSATALFVQMLAGLTISEKLPDRIEFYHKSIRDWLENVEEAGVYYANAEHGSDYIFGFIWKKASKFEYNSIPYSYIKHWRFYGTRSELQAKYKELTENIDFVLWTIEEYRRHSNFELAILEVNQLINMSLPTEKANYLAQIALNDIYIDLRDERSLSHLEFLLNNQLPSIQNDPYILIHLFENAGWIYMKEGKLDLAEHYFMCAIKEYTSLPYERKKKIRYAHTLYLYSVALYRNKKITECMDRLTESQELIASEESCESSLSYSLGLKMLAWANCKVGKRLVAEDLFIQALSVQNRMFSGKGLYVAHTLRCLAENEFSLYCNTSDKRYKDDAIMHLQDAMRLYESKDARYVHQIVFLSNLKEKMCAYEENKQRHIYKSNA